MADLWELPVDPRNVFANWYISNTDPALNTDNRVRAGKPWIKMTSDSPPWGPVLGLFVRNDDNTDWTSMLSSGPTGPAGPAGADGANGTDGSIIRSGSGAPSSGLGVDGDWYIDSATGDVYQKAAGTYSLIFNIKGPTGSTGATGPQGQIGLPGIDGEDGQDSVIPGPTGPAGAAGSTGPAGPTGPQGPQGPPGASDDSGGGSDFADMMMPPAVNLGSAAYLPTDTDGTLAANSDSRIATQKATKAYVDSAIVGGSTAGGADHLYLTTIVI